MPHVYNSERAIHFLLPLITARGKRKIPPPPSQPLLLLRLYSSADLTREGGDGRIGAAGWGSSIHVRRPARNQRGGRWLASRASTPPPLSACPHAPSIGRCACADGHGARHATSLRICGSSRSTGEEESLGSCSVPCSTVSGYSPPPAWVTSPSAAAVGPLLHARRP